MAYKRLTTDPIWYGLSTDTRPTLSAADVDSEAVEMDTGDRYKWDGNSWNQTHAAGVLLTSLSSTISGENINADRLKTVDACHLSVISKTTAVTIGAGAANDTYLLSILILAILTGTCIITGFADSDGLAQSITLPAGSVGEFNFRGALNEAGALTVTCSNVADDNLVQILWTEAV